MQLNREKINRELTRLGWKQTDLARQMGLHRQQINRLLIPGQNAITLKTIDKLADALGLDPKDLIK